MKTSEEMFNKLSPEEKLEYLEYTVSKPSELWWDSLSEREQLRLTAYSKQF